MENAAVSNLTFTPSTCLTLNLPTTIFPQTALPTRRYSGAPDVIPVSGRIVMGTLLAIGVISGVFGNILVLFAILLDKSLRKHGRNLMILNLAITDLLMTSFPMPILGVYIAFYWPKWNFGEILCKTTVYVAVICSAVSVVTLVLIAFDRYFAIVRNKQMLKRRNVKIVLCLSWLYGFVAPMHILRSPGITRHSFRHGEWNVCCRMDSKVISAKSYIYPLLIMQATGVFTEFSLLLTYARMGFFLWRVRTGPIDQGMKTRNTSRKIRALKLMFAIILVFCVCYFPYNLAIFLRIFPFPSDKKYIDPTFWLMVTSLAMLNSSINPVLYALVSQNFRVAYQNIIQRVRKQFSLLFRNETSVGRMNSQIHINCIVVQGETDQPHINRNPQRSAMEIR